MEAVGIRFVLTLQCNFTLILDDACSLNTVLTSAGLGVCHMSGAEKISTVQEAADLIAGQINSV
jgi:hypothetical protein